MASPLSRVFALGVAVSILALLPGPRAHAQGSAPGRDDEAREVFERGRAAYARGEYEGALAAFQEAYELSERPELLYNIGQTADRLRRDREALEAFDGYLAALPDAPNRAEVDARARVLREQIARDDALRVEAERARQPREDPPIVEAWWFWTLIGVAVVGAGVGIGFAVGSHDEIAPPTRGDLGPDGVIVALTSF